MRILKIFRFAVGESYFTEQVSNMAEVKRVNKYVLLNVSKIFILMRNDINNAYIPLCENMPLIRNIKLKLHEKFETLSGALSFFNLIFAFGGWILFNLRLYLQFYLYHSNQL
jgi:hypothetical protein